MISLKYMIGCVLFGAMGIFVLDVQAQTRPAQSAATVQGEPISYKIECNEEECKDCKMFRKCMADKRRKMLNPKHPCSKHEDEQTRIECYANQYSADRYACDMEFCHFGIGISPNPINTPSKSDF
jgi:hypothetical protein